MNYRIKICGITRVSDACFASEIGVWALGFIFYKKSKRFISKADAKSIINEVRKNSDVKIVGVFVNETLDNVNSIADDLGLDYVQLHGDEDAEYIKEISRPYIKVIHKEAELGNYIDSDLFLIDSFDSNNRGGTGKLSSWTEARKISQKKLISF